MPARPTPKPKPPIHVEGAASHNLKQISVSIPRTGLTVITGVSGSGKSSLAFDTLFAEGQRRYVESLSAYARQFLQKMPRPQVERISNLPPAIAIEQRNRVRNARSTVGTVTEVYDYLRLLFSKCGTQHCTNCGGLVMRETPGTVAERLFAAGKEEKLIVLLDAANQEPRVWRPGLLRDGFRRVLVKVSKQRFELMDLEDAATEDLSWRGVVVDRLIVKAEQKNRILEALEMAFFRGRGRAILYFPDRPPANAFVELEKGMRCVSCLKEAAEPRPVHFSFNSPIGACRECEGFGRVVGIDWTRVIPDESLSLRDGAIDPFTKPAYAECQADLQTACARLGIPMNRPWKSLNAAEKKLVKEGQGKWYGVKGFFEWLESKRYKTHVRVFLARYRGYTECGSCGGSRLRKESLAVTIGGRNLPQVVELPIQDLDAFFASIEWSEEQRRVAESVIQEIQKRLRFLKQVGLGYVTLARQARTLSGGEAQRIALASALGSALTDTLYVLDEPSIGLHPRDSGRLITVLESLRNLGNAVVLVEHDAQFMEHADHVIDLGPGAGNLGGQVVFEGSFEALTSSPTSETGRALRERTADRLRSQKRSRRRPTQWISIEGASIHNLENLSVRLPLGVLAAVSGVSGAGKSSLIENVLYANALVERGQTPPMEAAVVRDLSGLRGIKEICFLDQEPLGRSTRSNLATVIGVFADIRSLLASTPAARRLGLSAGAFSFNVPGGRCETCQGAGTIKVEMQFLEDLELPCEDCEGKRYGPKALQVQVRGKGIHEILGLTVEEAVGFFADQDSIVRRLSVLKRVGLQYLCLGQVTSQLSGGEAQRLKLAVRLAQGSGEGVLYLFDEPTTGLHMSDVEVLLSALHHLVDLGGSVLLIEHNLDVLWDADYILDMGPEGGANGGRVVAEGTPESLLEMPQSYTGYYLKRRLTAKIDD